MPRPWPARSPTWSSGSKRSYEIGIATLYHGLNRPLAAMKMGKMGLAMFARGRMNILPKRIKNVAQLQAIVNKAREIGGAS